MKIGQIQLSKDESSFYFKLGAGVGEKNFDAVQTLIKAIGSDVMFLEKPEAQIDSLLEKGFIDADQAAERKSKVPSFVKYNVSLPKVG